MYKQKTDIIDILVHCAATKKRTWQIRGGSRAAAISKMERLAIIGFQPLTIITKHSILHVAEVLDPPLQTELYMNSRIFHFIPELWLLCISSVTLSFLLFLIICKLVSISFWFLDALLTRKCTNFFAKRMACC